MKFVFNDSLLSSTGPVETSGLMSNNFVSSNIIIERKLVTAQIVDMDDLFLKLDQLKTRSDIDNFLRRTDVRDFLKKINVRTGDENQIEFNSKMVQRNQSGKNNSSSLNEYIQQGIQNAANATEDSASKFAPFLETKDQIIQRLKPFMSESEIGETFYKLEEKVKLPFTEVIGVLDYCIQKSRSCNSKASDIINFFIEHYEQKRQYGTVKNIIDQACEYQKLNPTIDVFSVLRDSVAGNQPDVDLGYLSKDSNDQLIFNNLIMLSQSSLPEQSEEIRRRFQQSRDALDAQQQKFNMQRAIYDMMKIEDSNQELVNTIKLFGEGFKLLLTQPMYRALRDMYYDLRASKILLNQAASVFGADTSPENRRSRPTEDMYHKTNTQFPYIVDERQPFSEPHHRFVKLASPEVSKIVFAQANDSNNQNNQVLEVLNFISDQIGGVYQQIVDKLRGFTDSAPLFKKISDLFTAMNNSVKTISNAVKNNNVSEQLLNSEFKKIQDILHSDLSKSNVFANNSARLLKTSQHDVQQGKTNYGGSENSQNFAQVSAIISSIAAAIFSVFAIKNSYDTLASVATGQWIQAANAIAPFLLGLKNLILQSLSQFGIIKGKNAPQSSYFYDNKGTLTPQGKQRLSNNQETMIALGIADQDAMALSKFSVQKQYYMKQLQTMEQNLKSAEQQVVQLGGTKTDYTVGDLPEDFQKKLKEFLDYLKQLEPQYKSALNIFRNAYKNFNNLNPNQQTQAKGLMAEFQNDLIEIQKKISEWSSMKNIAGHLMRKRILLQKLKPIQKQLDTLKKLGIPMSNVIASPNGILSLVGKIRSEEQQALDKLRNEHYEKMELLKNPDKTGPLVKYPTDTSVVKLPESQDQSESNVSPFEAPENSQFKPKEEVKTGV
jgi:hypothetical protein